MSEKTPPPYCLSRQHPELAKRSRGLRGPVAPQHPSPPPSLAPSAAGGPESAAGKGL